MTLVEELVELTELVTRLEDAAALLEAGGLDRWKVQATRAREAVGNLLDCVRDLRDRTAYDVTSGNNGEDFHAC